MGMVWGIVVVVLSLLGWGGQAVAWFAPNAAARLGLTEPEDAVEPVFHADIRGEAAWDALILWTLPVAGILLILDHEAWPYFGLFGAGAFVYFAGRGIATRLMLRGRGFRVGTEQNVAVAYLFLVIWGAMGGVTAAAAVVALAS